MECSRRKEWSVGGGRGIGLIESLVKTGKNRKTALQNPISVKPALIDRVHECEGQANRQSNRGIYRSCARG